MPKLSLSRRAFAGTLLAAAVAALGLPSLAAAQDYPDRIRIGSTAPGHLKFVLFRNLGLLQEEFEKEKPSGAAGEDELRKAIAVFSALVDYEEKKRVKPVLSKAKGEVSRWKIEGRRAGLR